MEGRRYMKGKDTNFSLLALRIGVSTVDETSGSTGIQVYNLSPNQLMELHYYEDITKANVVLALKINDTSSALLDSIIGMEPIDISWTDLNENVITYSMVIVDLQDRMVIDGKTSEGVIYCASIEAVKNSATKISRKFKGKTNEMVRDLCKIDLQSKKTLDLDPSLTDMTFVSPWWDPYTIISWLAWRSIPEAGNAGERSAGFLFYEDREGYHFKSMDKLVGQETTTTIEVNVEETEDSDAIHISSFTLSGSSDIFRGLNLGSYASTTFTLDMKDFKYEKHPYFISEYYPKMQKLNDRELPEFYKRFGDKGAIPTRIMTKVMDSAAFTTGKYTEDLTRQLSQSMIRNQFFFNQTGTFEYEGDQDLLLGEVVQINKYDARSGDLDIDISGRYIVGKIYRQFLTERDTMSTRVTVYRDSLG